MSKCFFYSDVAGYARSSRGRKGIKKKESESKSEDKIVLRRQRLQVSLKNQSTMYYPNESLK